MGGAGGRTDSDGGLQPFAGADEHSAAVGRLPARLGWDLFAPTEPVGDLDGRGSPKSWIEADNQAIALQVDGVVTTADIASLQEPVKAAAAQGIVLVGIHGWAFPGENKDLGVFYNIQQDPREIGKAQADWSSPTAAARRGRW